MATTEKQLEANRRNAKHSTGPKTDAGKQASRLNAVTHGLLAKAVVISIGDYKEDEGEFAQLLAELREDRTPVGMVEDLEVQKIAHCYWRKIRAVPPARVSAFDLDVLIPHPTEQLEGLLEYVIYGIRAERR